MPMNENQASVPPSTTLDAVVSSSTDDTALYLATHYLNQPSQLYAYLLWATLLVLLLVSKIPLPTRWKRIASNSTRWRMLKHRRFTQFWRRNKPDAAKFMPANGCIFLISAFFALLLGLLVAGPDYIPGPTFKVQNIHLASPSSTIYKSLWTSAARAGVISFALLPLCVLLALKSPPTAIFTWKITTRLHFDKLAVFHRWTARFLYFFTAVHVILWTVKLSIDRFSEDGGLAIEHAFRKNQFVCGWLAFGVFTVLMATSTSALRRFHYEAFYALHVLLFPVMLIACAFHHTETGWWAWLALALWLTERIWRCGRALYQNYSQIEALMEPTETSGDLTENTTPAAFPSSVISRPNFATTSRSSSHTPYQPPPGYVHAELLYGATVRLTYTSTHKIKWAPGQHFLLNIPVISRFTSHPFTCCSTFHEATAVRNRHQMVFLIRAKKGWTRRLWDAVASHTIRGQIYVAQETLHPDVPLPSSGLVMRMYIDGPFGSSIGVSWERHSGVLIVVGGSGVTYGLSILDHLSSVLASRKENSELQRIRFVWLVRDFGHIQWCASIIRRCKLLLPEKAVQIDIFVTKPENKAVDGPAGTGLSSEPLNLAPQSDVPSPAFWASTRRNSLVSMVSEETALSGDENLDSDIGHDDVQAPGESANRASFRSEDLTEFEGEVDIILPGEVSLSRQIKREGRVRRANTRKARRSLPVASRAERPRSPLRRSTMLINVPEDRTTDFETDGSNNNLLDPVEQIRRPKALSIGMPNLPALSIISHEFLDDLSPSTSKSERDHDPESPRRSERDSWLPLHCAPPQPPHAFSYGAPITTKVDLKEEPSIQIRLDERELKDISFVAESAKPGKPRLAQIIQYELEEAAESLMVTCCGPVSLDVLVREHIAERMGEEAGKLNGKSIVYYSEEFEY